jgi:hypothetical protein
MTQNQYDNRMLHLEWETKFAAAIVTAGMTKK